MSSTTTPRPTLMPRFRDEVRKSAHAWFGAMKSSALTITTFVGSKAGFAPSPALPRTEKQAMATGKKWRMALLYWRGSPLLEPNQWLGDGHVALDFRVGGVGREFLPE